MVVTQRICWYPEIFVLSSREAATSNKEETAITTMWASKRKQKPNTFHFTSPSSSLQISRKVGFRAECLTARHCHLDPPFLPVSCCSFAQQCPTLCQPMYCSLPGFPVLTISQSLLKFLSGSVMLSNCLILCCPLLLLPSIIPSISVFPKSWLFASCGQSIRASASVFLL